MRSFDRLPFNLRRYSWSAIALLACAVATANAAAESDWSAWGGETRLELNGRVLADLGLNVQPEAATTTPSRVLWLRSLDPGELVLRTKPEGPFRFAHGGLLFRHH